MALAHLHTHPADGSLALPLLTMSEAAFTNNVHAMLGYTRRHGVALAPHAKTAMSVDLAKRLLDAGAWGTTVADTRQAEVMLDAGLTRLILANQIGGIASARRLAAVLARHRDAELTVFADSMAAITALEQAWSERDDLPVLGLAVEVGAGRAGARTLAEAGELIEAVAAAAKNGRTRLAGIAAYEAAAVRPGLDARDAVLGILHLASDAFRLARRNAPSDASLILTVGGSSYFDLVVETLKHVVTADPAAILVLRSGAIFFHDHGIYASAMAAMFARSADSPAADFVPALRMWAEVLSRPEPGLAICGLGMRDVSFDQGFPVPLQAFRGSKPIAAPGAWSVSKLNDQHAFLALDPTTDLEVGDVVAFGISHPCTCIDHWHAIAGLDADDTVIAHYRTAFR